VSPTEREYEEQKNTGQNLFVKQSVDDTPARYRSRNEGVGFLHTHRQKLIGNQTIQKLKKEVENDEIPDTHLIVPV